jgi:hypothetical protein
MESVGRVVATALYAVTEPTLKPTTGKWLQRIVKQAPPREWLVQPGFLFEAD